MKKVSRVLYTNSPQVKKRRILDKKEPAPSGWGRIVWWRTRLYGNMRLAVALQLLGLEELRVGATDERINIGAVLSDGATDRDRDANRALRGLDLARSQGRNDTFGSNKDAGSVDRGMQQNHELVAAVAADNIGSAHTALDRLDDQPQGNVADLVAVGIVDGLEMVHVNHE